MDAAESSRGLFRHGRLHPEHNFSLLVYHQSSGLESGTNFAAGLERPTSCLPGGNCGAAVFISTLAMANFALGATISRAIRYGFR